MDAVDTYRSACFAPAPETSVISYEAKEGPYRIVIDLLGGEDERILMVNGLPGNTTDRDRRLGMLSVLDRIDGLEIVEVVGNWDTGTSQTAAANALPPMDSATRSAARTPCTAAPGDFSAHSPNGPHHHAVRCDHGVAERRFRLPQVVDSRGSGRKRSR